MRRNTHLLPSVPMPVPYGAHVVEDGVQFTIFSRHATRVWLMLFDEPDAATPSAEYELDPATDRIGDLWHAHISGAHADQYYLYRMDGQPAEGGTNFFSPNQWLLDPYALAISGSPTWGDPWGQQPGDKARNGPCFPKGVIIRDDFDWRDDRTLRTPLEDTIFYEAHVRGYTAHASSGVQHPGTYRGLIEKIPYLQDLGITAIEFLPIHEFNEMEYYQENMSRSALRNYWGYSTLAFFAPHGRYAAAGVHGQQVREFKELVVALHQAGIEVILDVVFNHTAEGASQGPVYSFRGIDNDTFYMMEEDGQRYRNYSGCGNTVNCNHPIVRDLIIDCLRYWVLHMHVDGFRFDLASVLTRGPDGQVLPNPSVVEHIAEDPALRDTKLVAEAWDAAGLYQVGSFPNEHWSEWNGRYRDDVREFWKGKPGKLRTLATRLTGSPDLYDQNGQTPLKSVNFITCHDGFTLRDLVSYEKKHNEANGEENRDGEDHNHSLNFGHEGPTKDKAILAARERQMKNLVATLLLSQGVPMLLAGDEMAQTQGGNNNAYCQDSELSWLNWSLLEEHKELHAFTRRLVALRKAHPCLRQTRFLAAREGPDGDPPLAWFGPDGHAPDWDEGLQLMCLLRGDRLVTGLDTEDDSFLLVFNTAEISAEFALPPAPGQPWRLDVCTQETPPALKKGQISLVVLGRSVTVLTSGMDDSSKRRRGKRS